MLHFLSPEALYGLLLVTTFASVGLLGLWAATSRWHPFLRTTIVLAILSVLLLRPMYEPFVMLVSQVATIAAGVALDRRFDRYLERLKANRKNPDPLPHRLWCQFSLRTLFIAMTVVALGLGIGSIVSQIRSETMELILAGLGAGMGTSLVALLYPSPNTLYKWFMLLVCVSGPNLRPLAIASFRFCEANPLLIAGDSNNAFLVVAIGWATLLTLIQFAVINLWMTRVNKNNAVRSAPSIGTVLGNAVAEEQPK